MYDMDIIVITDSNLKCIVFGFERGHLETDCSWSHRILRQAKSSFSLLRMNPDCTSDNTLLSIIYPNISTVEQKYLTRDIKVLVLKIKVWKYKVRLIIYVIIFS